MNTRLLEAFNHVPVSKHLGLELVALDATTATVVLDPKAELTQGYGFVQGGVISALADAAGVCLFLPESLDAANVTSIEFKINFLRPVPAGSGRLEARAKLVQRGQKVGVADVDVMQAGKPVAKGLFTYLLY
ncbi:MAG: PaaI family thioesterase [Planctomycetes bacterium]|nr:PaaI family thioesterase [Planctomycetota bacterium]